MRKIIAFVLVITMLLTLSVSALSASAADFGFDGDVNASYIYMEELNSGTVVHSLNAEEQVPPASLTKVMTYIVVAESVPDLENTYVTVTQDMLATMDPESSVMGLSHHIDADGTKVSVLELLYGLMLPSGNDAALALASYVGDGSIDKFVEMMNRKAGQLGCSSTHFVNPHGLHDPMHYSSALDLSVMTKYALEKPYFKEIVKSPDYIVESLSSIIENTNYMLREDYSMYYYPYVTGVKTGYTDQAGKCLISTDQNGDYEYLCIVLGTPYSYAEDVNYAMLGSAKLYEWAFNNISSSPILSKDEVIKSMAIEFVWGSEPVDVVPQQDVTALLPNNYDKSLVTTEVDLPEYLRAPVEKGEVVGSVSVFYDGEKVGTTNIVSSVTVERDQTNYLMHRMIGFVVNNIIWLSIVFAILVALVVMNVYNRRQRKKRQARRRYR
ncbi:MAG: D-alanyl-D-alanine carboxypeptidase [Ruminococcus sp.]|nr:D-alanyl-D-alanine carboxypeptidase [Ruminococcus sp.]